jgi:parvulin-like peptidyl-prolyl isomerase
MNLLREPLVHFAVAGALLFGAYEGLNRARPTSLKEEPVQIGEGELRWLRETFAGQWRRAPTANEMDGLVATLLEEELLAREARALGLDQHDTVVRRRLAQKLTFLVEDTSRIADPSEGELRRFYDSHADLYQTRPRVTFSHIFFNPERRRQADADAAAALIQLAAAGSLVDGDPMLFDDRYSDVDQPAVLTVFGANFARDVFAMAPGSWRGPVKSSYGLHLVRVTDLLPAEARGFETVRNAVMNDWRREREAETKAAYLAKLRDKYGVAADLGPKLLLSADGLKP